MFRLYFRLDFTAAVYYVINYTVQYTEHVFLCEILRVLPYIAGQLLHMVLKGPRQGTVNKILDLFYTSALILLTVPRLGRFKTHIENCRVNGLLLHISASSLSWDPMQIVTVNVTYGNVRK